MVLKNPAGEVVYRWSVGKVFAEGETSESLGGPKEYEMEGEIDGAGLADGIYTVVAWFTTADGPKFVATGQVEIFTQTRQ